MRKDASKPQTVQLLRAREVADRLGVHVVTLRKAVKDGTLPAIRLGDRGWLRFDPKALDEALSAGQRTAPADDDELEWR